MDTSDVKKFFALWKEDDQEKEETQTVRVMLVYLQKEVLGTPVHVFPHLIFLSAFLQDFDEMDLEMLAPYISMDDDFQLTFLGGLTEEASKPPSSSSELLAVAPVCRKRYDGPRPSLI